MTDAKPLAGLKIVVTRPQDQATSLYKSIQQAGGTPILFPLLEISAPADDRPLRDAISRLSGFGLAIFISPNAAKYGMQAILNAGPVPNQLKIAAIGQGSARILSNMGVMNVIAPQGRSDSESLLAVPELKQVKNCNIAIFRGDKGRELLGDTLRERGANIEYVPCYVRSKPHLNIGELLAANADALIVTSSEALSYLNEALGAEGMARIADTALFVPHQRIADVAATRGWTQVIQAHGGDEALLAGLRTWAADRRKT